MTEIVYKTKYKYSKLIQKYLAEKYSCVWSNSTNSCVWSDSTKYINEYIESEGQHNTIESEGQHNTFEDDDIIYFYIYEKHHPGITRIVFGTEDSLEPNSKIIDFNKYINIKKFENIIK